MSQHILSGLLGILAMWWLAGKGSSPLAKSC
jgi:hypothetical protein